MLFVDIDGNTSYSELNWTEAPSSFTYNDPTELHFTRDNSFEAIADTTEYPGITDSFPQVNFYVRFVHVTELRARFGVQTNIDSTSSSDRYHGLIFKCPDKYTSPTTISFDIDEDGVPNYLDLDSDNDGILDVHEAGHDMAAGVDGRILNVNANIGPNGLDDRVETSADSDTINYFLSNSEVTQDSTYDAYELDSDDDGCFDVREATFSDSDEEGIVGTGTAVVDTLGLVVSHTYPTPTNSNWQDSLQNTCVACATATMNPHIMYYRRN